MHEPQHETTGTASALHIGLIALAKARREGQILRAASAAAQQLAGAQSATLLSRDADRPPAHPLLQHTDRTAEATIPQAPRQIAERMRSGTPVVMTAPCGALEGLALPEGPCLVALLPASGSDSMSALCAFWSDPHHRIGPEAMEYLSVIATTAGLALERMDALRRERMRSAEMENRIRNVIAVVRSVSIRSADRATSMDQFMQHYGGRLDALARPQIAMARSGSGRTSFDMLLREELLALAIQEGSQVSLEGLPVALARDEAEALTLAIHELAVNALKFGAFSDTGGALKVRWWVESSERGLLLRVIWRERSPVPIDPAPHRVGFGRTYIERGVPYELGAETRMAFDPSGLTCSLRVPLGRPG